MLLSKNLLIKLNENYAHVTNEDLSSALNAIGIEVEKIIENKLHQNIKIGKLINHYSHPNSDHLNVCEVVLEDKKVQIVCGAPNIENNHWVVVATPGSVLKDDLEITEREVRGITSYGMMCSLNEILPSLSNYISESDKETIIQIPTNLKIDPKTFFEYYGFNDTIFELSIPSNRPELNGVFFLAYELNLQFNFTTKLDISNNFCVVKFLKNLIKKNNDAINIDFQSDINLDYFLAKVGINFSINYLWKTKLLLTNSGVKCSNNINNFGKLLTVLFAQPFLCIDSSLNVENKLSIEKLDNEIDFIDSNNNKLTLKKGTIVTKNKIGEIVSVTGMYLSQDFMIKDSTKYFYIESANFSEKYILDFKNNSQINDNTIAYFIKNPSSSIAKIGMSWVLKNKWFSVFDDSSFVYQSKVKNYEIINIKSYKQILNILGTKLSYKELVFIFRKIGILLLLTKVRVPSYRKDLVNVFDLAEEVLKYIDINKLEFKPINFSINDFNINKEINNIDKVKNYLVNKQFYEVKTYNLTSERNYNNFNWFGIENKIALENPISNEHKILRNNLIHEMLKVIEYNIQHKQSLLNIFEIQKIQTNLDDSFNCLSCLLTTNIFSSPLNKNNLKADDYTNKWIYEGIEDILGIKLRKQYNVDSYSNVYSENNFVLYDKNNNFVGIVGKLQNNYLKQNYKINIDVYFICLNLDQLLSYEKKHHTFWKVSELNPIYKDLTFNNPENIDLKDVSRKLTSIKHITNINLVDVYEKDNVKHYTIRLKIQPTDNNLTCEELTEIFQDAIESLRNLNLVVKEA